jgi:putative transposase
MGRSPASGSPRSSPWRRPAPQVELGFTAALQAEGLLARVEARHDDGRVDLTVEDETRPILLAVSDNGPQMTSGSTPELLT